MFKRNVFKILAMVFFLLAGATLYNSNKEIPKKVVTNKLVNKKKVSPSISHRPQLSPTIYNNLKPFTTSEPNQPTQIIVNPTNTPIPTQTTTPYNNSTKLTVSLTVAGSSIGSFEIPQGANQCDVLTQALSQGKLQSLNMRYNSDMGTNAVYQINGVGKENSVWWTFKVNGASPSQGCSYIKVASGDNVEWAYIGN